MYRGFLRGFWPVPAGPMEPHAGPLSWGKSLRDPARETPSFPLKAEITGSNPVRATKKLRVIEVISVALFVFLVACRHPRGHSRPELPAMRLEHSKSDMLTWEDFVRLMLPLMVNWSAVNIACKGAAVVAGVLGGVLALVGEEWVYMASALAGVAIIRFSCLRFPRAASSPNIAIGRIY